MSRFYKRSVVAEKDEIGIVTKRRHRPDGLISLGRGWIDAINKKNKLIAYGQSFYGYNTVAERNTALTLSSLDNLKGWVK